MSEFERLKPLLVDALERSGEGDTLEDLYCALKDGEAQFWPAKETVAVTEIVKSLNIWLYGGSMKELADLDASATAWAKEMGLDNISCNGGRIGWRRVLKKLGYVEEIIMVKEL